MVGREYSTDACNNIAIEFISIPLERTDGIEMSFCGSLMMKYYKYGDRQNKLKAMLKTFSNKNQNEKVAFRNKHNVKISLFLKLKDAYYKIKRIKIQ